MRLRRGFPVPQAAYPGDRSTPLHDDAQVCSGSLGSMFLELATEDACRCVGSVDELEVSLSLKVFVLSEVS